VFYVKLYVHWLVDKLKVILQKMHGATTRFKGKCMFVFVKEISSSTISDFRRVVADIHVLLGYYAGSSSNFHCLLPRSMFFLVITHGVAAISTARCVMTQKSAVIRTLPYKNIVLTKM